MAMSRSSPSRRLEDHIRKLCARAVSLDEPELSATLGDLQTAINEHLLHLSNTAIAANIRPDLLLDRRRS